jgi:hypothetical protein
MCLIANVTGAKAKARCLHIHAEASLSLFLYLFPLLETFDSRVQSAWFQLWKLKY